MSLSQPSFVSITNGEECVFLSWSPVTNATEYEIKLTTHDTRRKTIYSTTLRSILITKLENDRFHEVQVTALNEDEQSEPSVSSMVRPKLRQSMSTVKIRPGEKAGRLCLQWTSTPTDLGFQVERCDIGEMGGYKRVAWLPYNSVSTYEDQTNCDASKHSCSGHYYTVKYRDAAWWHGAGVLSKKVFCMSSTDSYSDIETEKYDELEENTDQNSVKEDENIQIDQTSKPPITDNYLVPTLSNDSFEIIVQSDEYSPNVTEEIQAQIDAPSPAAAIEAEEEEEKRSHYCWIL